MRDFGVDTFCFPNIPALGSDVKMRFLSLFTILLLMFIALSGCGRKKSAAQASGNTSSADNGLNPPLDPAQARVYLDQGKELYKADEDQKAAAAFARAVKYDPDYAEAYFRLGLAYDALAQKQEADDAYKKAIEAYKKIIKANPKDGEAHYNLGQSYSGLHLYSEAANEYRQASRLKTDDPEIFYDLGMALTRLAQYDEASAAFQKCLNIDPDNYRAQDALEEAREGSKRIKAGRKYAEEQLKKQQEEDKKKQDNANASSPQG